MFGPGSSAVFSKSAEVHGWDRLSLVFHFPKLPRKPHPFVFSTVGHNDNLYIPVPITIKTERFHKLIDLRIPEVAKWFARTFSRLHIQLGDRTIPAFPGKRPLSDFYQLLPTLYEQMRGGNLGFNQIAGLSLRLWGADALIFPSARKDAYVAIKDGRVVDTIGWNLVDYRNSARPEINSLIDEAVGWPEFIAASPDPNSDDDPYVLKNAQIKLFDSGPYASSWIVTGVEATNKAFHSFGELMFLIGHVLDGRFEEIGRDLKYLYYNDLMQNCRYDVQQVMVNAIMGTRGASDAVLDWARTCIQSSNREKLIASGSTLTFESGLGFPTDSRCASLAHANRHLHHPQAC